MVAAAAALGRLAAGLVASAELVVWSVGAFLWRHFRSQKRSGLL